MKDRIKLLMTQVGLSQQEFATKLEISPASLSSIFNGRTNPTNTHVSAVHRAFPNVNISWLLFGEGDMYLDTDVISNGSCDVSSGEVVMEGGDSLSMASPGLVGVVNPEPNYQQRVNFHQAETVQKSVPTAYNPASFWETKSEKKCDNFQRKVKEIRVFYDDGTYESFIPSVK